MLNSKPYTCPITNGTITQTYAIYSLMDPLISSATYYLESIAMGSIQFLRSHVGWHKGWSRMGLPVFSAPCRKIRILKSGLLIIKLLNGSN